MFKKSQTKKTQVHQAANNHPGKNTIDTVIGSTSTIDGNILFSGNLKIDGIVNGNVTADDEGAILIINEEGQIQGEVKVANIMVNGKIDGNIFASKKAIAPGAAPVEMIALGLCVANMASNWNATGISFSLLSALASVILTMVRVDFVEEYCAPGVT